MVALASLGQMTQSLNWAGVGPLEGMGGKAAPLSLKGYPGTSKPPFHSQSSYCRWQGTVSGSGGAVKREQRSLPHSAVRIK